MTFLELELEWCGVCNTQHGSVQRCPGIIEVTGPERNGRRFAGHRPTGVEAYQILIAPVGERWQARIVTLPDTPWKVPERRGVVKFLDDSAVEAERKAVVHLYRRCKVEGIRVDEIGSQNDRVPDDLPTGRRMSGKRFDRRITALFGVDRPKSPALIVNVSENGLGFETAQPEPVGAKVRVLLQAGQFRVPLTGIVVWSRRRSERELPAGMGIEIDEAPFAFRQLFESLKDTVDSEAP